MTSDRHERTIEIFNDALEVDTDERSDFVRRACGDDSSLRREVKSLLTAAKAVPGSGLLAPSSSSDGADGRAPPVALRAGERLAAYTITGVLGEGGMGVVYRAEQDSPQRTVALKVIRPGRLARSARRRFAYEAEVLGRLHHPGIAQIYEAGTADTPHGDCPFFAMELVDGRPLTEYADAVNLDTRERLTLLAEVCDAVQHAHHQGVIHRDLKPGNILVDHEGRPKVLDFGVARAVDSDVAVTTMRTHVGELVGTLHYMSPEQCEGDPTRLDTRSDIYALGVVAWELLAGDLPYDVRGKALPEAIRVIRETDPRTLGSMSGALRGDVETIVAKAIEKEREQRYQSAAGLASDIRRFLRDEPIVARPPSALYQLSRFTKRNRRLVAAAAVVAVVVAAGVAATAWQAGRASLNLVSAERTRVDRESNSGINTAILTALARAGLIDRDALEPVLADMTVARIDALGALDFDLTAYARLGDALARVGRYDQALELLERVVQATERGYGESSYQALRTRNVLADVQRAAGQLDEAERMARSTLGRMAPAGDAARRGETAYTHSLREIGLRLTLADVLRDRGRLVETGEILATARREALDALSGLRALDPVVIGIEEIEDNPLVLAIRLGAGDLALAEGDAGVAAATYDALLDVHRDDLQSGDDLVIKSIETRIAAALVASGRVAEAAPLAERAHRHLSLALGAESPHALRAAVVLAAVRTGQGRHDDARSLLAAAVETGDRRYPDHWQTAVRRGELGIVLRALGHDADAQVALDAAHARLVTLFGEADARTRHVRDAMPPDG